MLSLGEGKHWACDTVGGDEHSPPADAGVCFQQGKVSVEEGLGWPTFESLVDVTAQVVDPAGVIEV